MRLVLCNCPAEDADRLAKFLVQEGLAACVNALPGVRSTYLWEGKLCVEEETTLLIKTRAEMLDTLIPSLAKAHPYDVPEIIALPIEEGHTPYLEWVKTQTAYKL